MRFQIRCTNLMTGQDFASYTINLPASTPSGNIEERAIADDVLRMLHDDKCGLAMRQCPYCKQFWGACALTEYVNPDDPNLLSIFACRTCAEEHKLDEIDELYICESCHQKVLAADVREVPLEGTQQTRKLCDNCADPN